MSNDSKQFMETLATILETDAKKLRAMSLQDLDAICRQQGRAVERVVRAAELAIQRRQKLRHGNVQDLGDGREVLDGPSRPPPEPH